MALAVVLVVGSGLMIKSFSRVLEVDSGISPHGVLTWEMELPKKEYPDNGKRDGAVATLEERLRALPGVRGASVTTGVPTRRQLNANDIMLEGKTQTKDGPAWNVDFVQTIGEDYLRRRWASRWRAGARFTAADNGDGELVGLVNEQFARRFYPCERSDRQAHEHGRSADGRPSSAW